MSVSKGIGVTHLSDVEPVSTVKINEYDINKSRIQVNGIGTVGKISSDFYNTVQ